MLGKLLTVPECLASGRCSWNHSGLPRDRLVPPSVLVHPDSPILPLVVLTVRHSLLHEVLLDLI